MLPSRRILIVASVLAPVAASCWSTTSGSMLMPRAARLRVATSPRLFSDDQFDTLVLYGDVGVLVGYGAVQAAVDASLMPLATAQPDLFTQSLPVLAAPLQGIVVAALWCSITIAVRRLLLSLDLCPCATPSRCPCCSLTQRSLDRVSPPQLDGYRAGATRTLPSQEAIIPLLAAWLGSSAILLALFAALGFPLDAELEFVFGSATVVGGWRVLYSNKLPLL